MLKNAYSVKSVSSDAVISCVLGTIALLFLMIAIIASYRYDGNGPAIVGLLGIGSLILSGNGIVFSVAAWKSQDGGFLMKRLAMFLNIIPLAVAFLLYVIGWII